MLFSTEEPVGRPTISGNEPIEPFRRLISHLLVYKFWLVMAAFLGILLGGLALCFITPRYEAVAVVIVDSRRDKLADAESALSSIVIDQYQSALKSELELIQSQDLAADVIKSLGLLHTPEYQSALTHTSTASRFEALRTEWLRKGQMLLHSIGLADAVDPTQSKPLEIDGPGSRSHPGSKAPDGQTVPGLTASVRGPQGEAPADMVMQNAVKIFQKSFWADNEPKSLTIRLGYRSTSPQLAAAITNAVLQRYLAADAEMKSTAMDRSQAWLGGRIARLRSDLGAAEHAVEDFRASHELSIIRDRSPMQQELLSPLQNQLLQVESRQVDAEAELSTVRAKVVQSREAGGSDIQAMVPEVLASPLIQGLRQQQATLLVQQAQLSATLGPKNPSMIKIASQVARIDNAIRREVDRITHSDASDMQMVERRLADLANQSQEIQARINAENAADIQLRSLEADAAAKRTVLDSFTQRYEQNTGTPLTPPDSRVVSWASVPVDAVSPRYGLVLAGSMFGFTFLAFAISLAVERLRRGFDTMQEVEAELGLVVAGLTPARRRRSRHSRKPFLVADPPPTRELALTVRALAHTTRTRIPARVVLITSAVAGEGKSTMALSLARSVANGGQRCLLIDADIRSPSLHSTLGEPVTPGLVELTVDRVPVDTAMRRVNGERFDFLPAGGPTHDLLTPFTIGAFDSTLAEMKSRYDVIVIDSPPVLLASECLLLVGCADLTLFLVKWRATPREIARKATLLLTRFSVGPCLAVLSQVNLRRMRHGGERRVEEQYRKAYAFSGSD